MGVWSSGLRFGVFVVKPQVVTYFMGQGQCLNLVAYLLAIRAILLCQRPLVLTAGIPSSCSVRDINTSWAIVMKTPLVCLTRIRRMPSMVPIIGAIAVVIGPEVCHTLCICPDLYGIDPAVRTGIQKLDLDDQREFATPEGNITVAPVSPLTITAMK
jgi:hypothetical protein